MPVFYVRAQNYTPFIPPSEAAEEKSALDQPLLAFLLGFEPSTYGVVGVLSGAALVFFVLIGFDVVATTAEEAQDPQRTIPRAVDLRGAAAAPVASGPRAGVPGPVVAGARRSSRASRACGR